MAKQTEQTKSKVRGSDLRFVLKIIGIAAMTVIAAALVSLFIYSLVAVANAPFCPSAGGNKKIVCVMDDSLDPDIPRGAAIKVERPASSSGVPVGAIVAFKAEHGVVCREVLTIVHTHDGGTEYDVAAPGVAVTRVAFADIIGVYTGDKANGLGEFLAGIGSPAGTVVIALLVAAFAGVAAYIIISTERARRKELETAALERSIKELNNINLRYDNICEITAVLDVLEMLTTKPDTSAERKEYDARLRSFVDANTIELPQTPETAAVLDSLPAPDNPDTLAAALRSGATLRQSDDGQTLVLTGLSGGKSILLTPIQTPDGVMLCRQGVRIRADIAPDLESIGISSMPSFPEFFEGQPIEKHVAYPELPQPHEPFGPNTLNRFGAAPEITDIEQAVQGLPKSAVSYSQTREITSHSAYNDYLAIEAPKARRQAKKLEELIDAAKPLTPSEREIVAKYKADNAEPKKPKQKPQLTPEQAAAKKAAAAEKRKQRQAEKREFIESLSAADREKYEAEQNLKKVRAAAIRKLKKAEADRKILDNLDK